MRLTSKDEDILGSLDRFGQMSSTQICKAHFSEAKSKTSFDRVAKKLVRDKFILPLGQAPVEGTRGGSGPAVYQLGPNGALFLGKRGKFRPRYSAISRHALKVADAFALLCEADDSGLIKILGYNTEPDSHMKIAGVTVRPDLDVVLALVEDDVELPLWIEVDRGTENRTEIQRKVKDYVHAFDYATREEIETVPEVLFLSDKEAGVDRLNGFLYGKLTGTRLFGSNQEARDYRSKIRVDLLDGFAERLK